jgi:Integral membrane protein
MTQDDLHLTRQTLKCVPLEWSCNPYWTKVNLQEKGGRVPHYVTLSGAGREIEIGAFLREDERKELYAELKDKVARIAHP